MENARTPWLRISNEESTETYVVARTLRLQISLQKEEQQAVKYAYYVISNFCTSQNKRYFNVAIPQFRLSCFADGYLFKRREIGIMAIMAMPVLSIMFLM